jgi:hypothetical protein
VFNVNEENLLIIKANNRRIIIRRAQVFKIVRNIYNSIRVRKSQKNRFLTNLSKQNQIISIRELSSKAGYNEP